VATGLDLGGGGQGVGHRVASKPLVIG